MHQFAQENGRANADESVAGGDDLDDRSQKATFEETVQKEGQVHVGNTRGRFGQVR